MGTDNCEATNITPTDDIIVQFRATNNGGTTTGASTTYRYDNTGPTPPDLIQPADGSGIGDNFVDLIR